MKSTTKSLVKIAVIAALYAAVTLSLPMLSYGGLQFRVSEALTILPFFFWEAIPGLFIGCIIANIPMGPMDMVLGSAATLVAAVLTYSLRKAPKAFGFLPPVIVNALVVPVILLTIPGASAGYFMDALTVFIGQAGVVFTLGVILYLRLKNMFSKDTRFARILR